MHTAEKPMQIKRRPVKPQHPMFSEDMFSADCKAKCRTDCGRPHGTFRPHIQTNDKNIIEYDVHEVGNRQCSRRPPGSTVRMDKVVKWALAKHDWNTDELCTDISLCDSVHTWIVGTRSQNT